MNSKWKKPASATRTALLPIRIGLLGLGTVGGGVVSVLYSNAREITRRTGHDIVISHAAATQYNPDIPNIDKIERLGEDAFAVVNDPQVDIVVELIGGFSPARELVLQAIENGKHVVTANKALIALHGNEIFAAAERRGVMVLFEAAVGGGIPIIKAIRESLAANHIDWVAGIINGTANYILSAMSDQGRDFDVALKEAQVAGYAEADPGFDIDGEDAAHKLAILGSVAFGIPLQFERIGKEGIASIEPQDIRYAAELGYCIKHLGIARRGPEGIEMRVHPALIPAHQLLASVDGVMNAVLVSTDALGPSLYYGAGAGSRPTASAVLADIMDISRVLGADSEHRVPYLAFQPDAMDRRPVLGMEHIETAYYLRMRVKDRPGTLALITNILGDSGISIDSILQKEKDIKAGDATVIMLTRPVREQHMNRAMARISELDEVPSPVARIRVEPLQ